MKSKRKINIEKKIRVLIQKSDSQYNYNKKVKHNEINIPNKLKSYHRNTNQEDKLQKKSLFELLIIIIVAIIISLFLSVSGYLKANFGVLIVGLILSSMIVPIFFMIKLKILGIKCNRCKCKMETYEHALRIEDLELFDVDLIPLDDESVYIRKTFSTGDSNSDKSHKIGVAYNIWNYCDLCHYCLLKESRIMKEPILYSSRHDDQFNLAIKLLKSTKGDSEKLEEIKSFLQEYPIKEKLKEKLKNNSYEGLKKFKSDFVNILKNKIKTPT